MRRVAFYLAGASAVAILFSIALSQIFLALALVAVLASGGELRFPPIKLPLALFFSATVISLLLSGDPCAGLPQIKKFFVFGVLLAVCSTFRTAKQVRAMVILWGVTGSVSAARGIFQFYQRYRQAEQEHADIYSFVVDGRITGLASHWMTFGGEQMIVLLMLAALLMFSRERKWRVYGWICLPVLSVAIVLGLTRSVFLLGVPVGGAYLLWNWKRRVAIAAPAFAAVVMLAAPIAVRERVASAIWPHGEVDSNQRRAIMRRTGWEMVKAHPWFGLGPEQIQPQFNRYVPAEIPRPLPPGWYGHLHNIYLQYAAERGVPAMLMMMWLIGKVLSDFLGALRGMALAREARFVLRGAVAVILAILAEGFFEHNLGDSEVLTLFLVVVSCGYVGIWQSLDRVLYPVEARQLARELRD